MWKISETVVLLRWHLDGDELEGEVLLRGSELPRHPDDPRRVGSRVVGADPRGGFVVGEPWGYELARYDADGDLLYRTGRELERPLRSPEELEAARRFNESLRARGINPAIPAEESPHFRSHGLRIDQAGRLWVLTRRRNEPGSVFDVFTAEGEFLGGIAIEGRIGGGYALWDLEAGRLAAAVPGDDGNAIVRIWQIIDS